jgi:hypothetical protein
MKIYINNFNLNNIYNIQKSLTDILVDTQNYTELYTNESIYYIDFKNIFSLEAKDGEISVYNNYFNNISLIVDNSYFKKKPETSINGNVHLHKKIKKNTYKLNAKSNLSFVIEMVDNLYNNIYVPNDVYFEYYKTFDIKELFIKQELIEFLSLLN